MKCLLFVCFVFVGCTHSPTSGAPVSSTAVIPSATTTTPPSNDPTPAASASSRPIAAGDPCDNPTPWPVGAALSAKDGEIVILAWKQKVDERPLYVDEALVWQNSPMAGYALAHVYRHPKDENVFRLSVVFDAPIEPEKSYDHPPTANEMRAFLKGTTWSDDVSGFKRTAGEICTKNWSRVLGSRPPADIMQ
ncbi:MAG: hypothetical protein ABI461_09560 [Polyangiaceae bacterium]